VKLLIKKKINEYFSQKQKKAKVELHNTIQIVSSLQMLRMNYSKESMSWEMATSQILNSLTIRQKALFFLEAEYLHKSVIQLKSIWLAVMAVTSGSTV